jgi:hypothetical protein
LGRGTSVPLLKQRKVTELLWLTFLACNERTDERTFRIGLFTERCRSCSEHRGRAVKRSCMMF